MGIEVEPEYSVDKDGTQEWRVNGQYHRLDGPARIWTDGTQEWGVNGQLHRLDGPARIWADGTQEWWVRGQLHRLDGPARIWTDGTQEWRVRHQNITQQVKLWMQTHGVTWPWDEETQMQFQLTWG